MLSWKSATAFQDSKQNSLGETIRGYLLQMPAWFAGAGHSNDVAVLGG